jgi:hypothetical protein
LRAATAVFYGSGRNGQRERKGGSVPGDEQVYRRYLEIFTSRDLSAPPKVVDV